MVATWETALPMKIKIFLWQVSSDRLPSAEQLVKRNWPGDIECKVCGQVESTDHILFKCDMVQFVEFC